MRAKEFTTGNQDLIIFDIDDTLLHTTAKIKVIDATGAVKQELTNQEFNNYQLQPGEQFDFGEFRNAEKFRQESKPIAPMIRKLKTILAHAGNAKVIMLTARADFDNKETFLQTFHDLGIDMSRIHVHRAGNLPGDEPPAYKKAVWVRRYLDTKRYGHVRLYDDSMSNLRVFKALKNEYPDVDFRAMYVGPSGSTQAVEGQGEGKWHKSPSGKWTNMPPTDDDYAINYGPEGLAKELEEACWKNYKQVGMKKKGKKTVPNCVPK